ncbi:MAG: TonB-dependent receptor [Pseudomonadales bacterium]
MQRIALGAVLCLSFTCLVPLGFGVRVAHGAVIEEILVTARKREESVQDVPVAVTALDATELEWQGVVGVEDLVVFAPNVRVSNSSRGQVDANFNIRGRGTADVTPVFDPSVGLYLDDVYVGRTQGALLNLVDIASVQIMRGPQGTLFGRNNIGGAVLINSREPTDVWEIEVGGRAGNLDLLAGHAIVNVPVNERLALRGSYQRSDRDGYEDNLFTGKKGFADEDEQTWRVAARIDVTDSLEILLQHDGTRRDSKGTLPNPQGPGIPIALAIGAAFGTNNDPAGLAAVANSLGHHEALGDIDTQFEDLEVDGYSGRLTWDMGGAMTLVLVGGYREHEIDRLVDQDGLPSPIANTRMPNSAEQAYVEARVNGSAISDRLEWVVGINWFDEDAEINVHQNLETLGRESYSFTEVNNSSAAVFAHATYQFTPKFSGAAGLRYTEDDREIVSWGFRGTQEIAGCVVNPSLRPAPTICLAENDETFDYVSWEVSGAYAFSDALMAYGRLAKGFKSGGFNASVQTGFFNPFEPEEVLEWELGVKGDFFGRRLRTNAAVFLSDYSELQRQVIRVIEGTNSVFTSNAGDATIWGMELEATAYLSDSLMLRVAAGYTDAEYDKFDFVDPVTMMAEDLSDNDFALVPKYNYSATVRYEIPVPMGLFGAQVSWSYEDDYELGVENVAGFKQSGFGLLNARAAYTSSDLRWEVAVFGSNLLDKEYSVFGSNFPIGAPLLMFNQGAPRMYGLEFRYRHNGS